MKVVFRVDASLDIGNGHVMRCLTLAEALREKGADCQFVCRAHPGNLLDLIHQRDFDTHILPSQQFTHSASCLRGGRVGESKLMHAAWLGAEWTLDAVETKDGIGETMVDWLIVDHYALDFRWEQQLRSACRRLMVIDDLADRPHDCDLLLDQNLGRVSADYDDLVPHGCTVLVGPLYAILLPEFAALRDYSFARRVNSQLKHLLITMGGVDKDNATGQVLHALKNCPLPTDCRISIVMGLHAPWLEQVRDQAAQMPWATDLLVNVREMAKLTANCDVAIGAAGMSAWERCCLGVPTLTMVLAVNQVVGAVALKKTGAVLLLEDRGRLATELHEKIAFLLDSQRLQAMQHACGMVTKGDGAVLLAEKIMNTNVN